MNSPYRFQTRPIRRYRMSQRGDFPLLQALERNDPPAQDAVELRLDDPSCGPASDHGQGDLQGSNSHCQAEAISRQGGTLRPPGGGAVADAGMTQTTGQEPGGLGNSRPDSLDGNAPIPPAHRSANPRPEEHIPASDPIAPAIPPGNTGDSIGNNAPKRPFRLLVEDWIKAEKLPYVRVDEAKRALFAGARLRSFHFVIYMAHNGPNWLLWAGPLSRQSRLDMQQWESIFGEEFKAVIARPSTNARGFSLQTLASQTVRLPVQPTDSKP